MVNAESKLFGMKRVCWLFLYPFVLSQVPVVSQRQFQGGSVNRNGGNEIIVYFWREE